MKLPLPFPYCPKCEKQHSISYHKDCGGALEIDPETEIVYCPKCGKNWDSWDSEYHCRCGNTFEANEVKKSVNELIEDCRECAELLELETRAYWKRKRITEESKRGFISDFIKGLGYSLGKAAGYVIEKIVEFVVSIF